MLSTLCLKGVLCRGLPARSVWTGWIGQNRRKEKSKGNGENDLPCASVSFLLAEIHIPIPIGLDKVFTVKCSVSRYCYPIFVLVWFFLQYGLFARRFLTSSLSPHFLHFLSRSKTSPKHRLSSPLFLAFLSRPVENEGRNRAIHSEDCPNLTRPFLFRKGNQRSEGTRFGLGFSFFGSSVCEFAVRRFPGGLFFCGSAGFSLFRTEYNIRSPCMQRLPLQFHSFLRSISALSLESLYFRPRNIPLFEGIV